MEEVVLAGVEDTAGPVGLTITLISVVVAGTGTNAVRSGAKVVNLIAEAALPL